MPQQLIQSHQEDSNRYFQSKCQLIEVVFFPARVLSARWLSHMLSIAIRVLSYPFLIVCVPMVSHPGFPQEAHLGYL